MNMITMFSPTSPFKVYCSKCYYSDNWDPLSYGRDYDFSKPFFKQWDDLQHDVPQLALMQENVVNSTWVNYEMDAKNCYLNFGGGFNEDSAYNQYNLKSKDSFDNFWVMNSQLAYESILCERGYNLFFSRFCYDCRETYFSFDCRDCSNIFGCTGLRHKKNYIYNKPVSEEEFNQFLKDNKLGSCEKLDELKKKSEEFWKTQPQRAAFIEKSVNSTGNIIKESKNCLDCWNAEKTEDSKHLLFTLQVKDAMDTTSVWLGEKIYETIAAGEKLSNLKFSTTIIKGSTNIEYSHFIMGCSNCFGSTHLRNKNYCILNKQYSKEEYENLMRKIRRHMDDMPYIDSKGRKYVYGEFFAPELFPYGYNETVAYEYFPMTKQEAENHGYKWNDSEISQSYEFSDYAIPDNINDIKDDILDKVLRDVVSGKAYRIIPMELAFYRRIGFPIPHSAPFERHRKRLKLISDHLNLYQRKCGKCGIAVESVYKENEFPIVYCERCYNAEII